MAFQSDSALENIGTRAFYESGLESFTAPLSLRTIGDEAFCNCRKLKSANLNEGLEFIGEDSFSNTRIREATLPTSLKRIANGSFWPC